MQTWKLTNSATSEEGHKGDCIDGVENGVVVDNGEVTYEGTRQLASPRTRFLSPLLCDSQDLTSHVSIYVDRAVSYEGLLNEVQRVVAMLVEARSAVYG